MDRIRPSLHGFDATVRSSWAPSVPEACTIAAVLTLLAATGRAELESVLLSMSLMVLAVLWLAVRRHRLQVIHISCDGQQVWFTWAGLAPFLEHMVARDLADLHEVDVEHDHLELEFGEEEITLPANAESRATREAVADALREAAAKSRQPDRPPPEALEALRGPDAPQARSEAFGQPLRVPRSPRPATRLAMGLVVPFVMWVWFFSDRYWSAGDTLWAVSPIGNLLLDGLAPLGLLLCWFSLRLHPHPSLGLGRTLGFAAVCLVAAGLVDPDLEARRLTCQRDFGGLRCDPPHFDRFSVLEQRYLSLRNPRHIGPLLIRYDQAEGAYVPSNSIYNR